MTDWCKSTLLQLILVTNPQSVHLHPPTGLAHRKWLASFGWRSWPFLRPHDSPNAGPLAATADHVWASAWLSPWKNSEGLVTQGKGWMLGLFRWCAKNAHVYPYVRWFLWVHLDIKRGVDLKCPLTLTSIRSFWFICAHAEISIASCTASEALLTQKSANWEPTEALLLKWSSGKKPYMGM